MRCAGALRLGRALRVAAPRRGARVARLLFLGGGLLFSAVACGGSCADPAHRDEAAKLSRAIDGLRDAPNSAKASHLEQLRKATCSHGDTCGLRDRCAQAYALHVDALQLISAARKETDAAKQLLAVTKAELELKQALTKTAACTDAQGELIRAHRLGDLR